MFKKLRKKIQLRKRIVIEVLETLITICKYLKYEAVSNRKSHFVTWFGLHEAELQVYSDLLKLEVEQDGNKQ